MVKTTAQQEIMARHLNLNPATPEDWPMDLIDRLIWLQAKQGRPALMREIRRVIAP